MIVYEKYKYWLASRVEALVSDHLWKCVKVVVTRAGRLQEWYYYLLLLFIRKNNKIQNTMYHCSQLATAIRGEQWLDALN